jgi:hypothetical protein
MYKMKNVGLQENGDDYVENSMNKIDFRKSVQKQNKKLPIEKS